MGINYVENDHGRRRIRWSGLFLFLAFCLSIPLLVMFLLPGTPAARYGAGCMGLASGILIFSIAFRRSLKMPVERLPRSTGR